MDDLVQWLGEQLDEDERILSEANTSPEIVTGIPRSYAAAPVALHIAAFADPARVLREIDAKRRVLTEYVAAGDAMDRAARDNDTAGYNTARAERQVLGRVIRRDAAVYADRPGFREEWRL
ncbi:DUF6221 family protein [Streptomyces alboflavus]|uniref:DUF6221 family protein n=1 Tax=Streptomyces alboflavus TaxID=67267 RepID=UPI000996E783|nr:DUF6221 family protein [Streptomyces alboflavus]